MILMMGALASVVCMSIYTGGLASRIASVKHIDPTLEGLHDLGYTWVLTQYQVNNICVNFLTLSKSQLKYIMQNESIVKERPDFIIDSLLQRKATYK